jgi:TM2 domain-containing membrane protein YozV
MFCKKCGADIGDSRYCPVCGQSAETPVRYEQKSGVKVNKIAYGLIAIFLGDLGIHRFYARKILSGVIYLLFCWTAIPGILGLVEGILALIKDSDEDGNLTVDPDSFFV